MTAHRVSGTARFPAGFHSLTDERQIDELPVAGELPDWLSGQLLRNGPALFDTSRAGLRHWFDGQAMLHRFGIADGTVSYTNRLLDTPASRAVRDAGTIRYGEFATDPCGSLFGRFFARFSRRPTPNANVNVARVGGHTVALTEVPLPIEFDPQTLATVGAAPYADDLPGDVTTAHPHVDPGTGDLINFTIAFGRRSRLRVYRQPPEAAARTVIGSVSLAEPGYLHSFAVTERHVVLAIFPLVVNPLSFLLRGRPFIENYRWRPERGTRIVVLDSSDGSVRCDITTDPMFAFHHINAFDSGDDVVVDLCAYPDARVIGALYLDRLRAGGPVPTARPTRLRVTPRTASVTHRVLTDEPMELPTVAYRDHNGRDYRYAYGAGASDRSGANFLDQLVKLDTTTGQTTIWRAPDSYPGEPVFVPRPGGDAEDDGVVLSVALDTQTTRSALVVLDAASFTEIARAEVPHAIPFGFHGQFSRR